MAFRPASLLGALGLVGVATLIAPSCSQDERPPPLGSGNPNSGGGSPNGTGTGSGSGGAGGSGGGTGGSAPAQCTDGVKNGGETSLDCGGPVCDPCGDSADCQNDDDCKSRNCAGAGPGVVGICAAATCNDGKQDGNETDVDCGSSTVPPWDNTACGVCGDQKKCNKDSDCKSGSCTGVGGKCVPKGCNSQSKDGDETDVDCGGSCAGCDDGKVCVKDGDCLSKQCTGGVCAAASCSNTQKDGDETDIDCGGATHLSGSNPACPACADYKGCEVDKDCLSFICDKASHLCQPPKCNDSIQNGNETGVDCGGGCPKKCADLGGCKVAADCQSGVCDPQGFCKVPQCDDGVANGDESDVDCGGSCFTSPCRPGLKCKTGADCHTGICTNGYCDCPDGMAIAPVYGGGATYCIDDHEVNKGEYVFFYNANPSTVNQVPQCQWNQSYAPSGSWPPEPPGPQNGNKGTFDRPVTYVDWCDAYAYCAFKGKHLCGKISGGPNAVADYTDFQKSAWYNACSNSGSVIYPYGNTYQLGRCWLGVVGGDGKPDLGVFKDEDFKFCLGGPPTVLHMSGNVAEWEDSCTGANGPNDQCRVRGGSSAAANAAVEGRCDNPAMDTRSYAGGDVGFRCCL